MPDLNNVNVTVAVSFDGVTYDPATKQFAGFPTFSVASRTQVPSGSNLITWTLSPTSVPPGFNAQFAVNGIVFQQGWVGDSPSSTSPTTFRVEDDFDIPQGGTPVDYEYDINVSLVSQTDSTVNETWTYDPDVENEPVVGHSAK